MPSSDELKLPAAHLFSCLLAYWIAYLFICLLAWLLSSLLPSLLGYLLTWVLACLIACSLGDLFASWLAYLPTYLLASSLPCSRAFFLLFGNLVFLLSCLPSCFLLLATCFLQSTTCNLLPNISLLLSLESLEKFLWGGWWVVAKPSWTKKSKHLTKINHFSLQEPELSVVTTIYTVFIVGKGSLKRNCIYSETPMTAQPSQP